MAICIYRRRPLHSDTCDALLASRYIVMVLILCSNVEIYCKIDWNYQTYKNCCMYMSRWCNWLNITSGDTACISTNCSVRLRFLNAYMAMSDGQGQLCVSIMVHGLQLPCVYTEFVERTISHEMFGRSWQKNLDRTSVILHYWRWRWEFR